MAKVIVVDVVIPELPEGKKKWEAGDTFSVEVEIPAAEKKQRGQLAGIALEDMTDEQLKREIINANSVLYKAKQRGAADATIAANQARVDAAKAEQNKRKGVSAEADTTPADAVEGVLDGTPAEVDAETASEM